MQIEEDILSNISNKEFIDKEKEKIKNYNINELDQLKLSKEEYESDLNYIKKEIKNVKIEMENFKIHEDENFENILYYIIDLGKEIGNNEEIPLIIDKRNLTELVSFSKKTTEKLANIENIINTNILKIENILNYGKKEDKELMEKLILSQKNKNKREKQLKIQKMQEEMKILKNLQIIERARKIVIKGRKVCYDYPNMNNRNIIKKVIKRENDDNYYEYQYSNYDERD